MTEFVQAATLWHHTYPTTGLTPKNVLEQCVRIWQMWTEWHVSPGLDAKLTKRPGNEVEDPLLGVALFLCRLQLSSWRRLSSFSGATAGFASPWKLRIFSVFSFVENKNKRKPRNRAISRSEYKQPLFHSLSDRTGDNGLVGQCRPNNGARPDPDI